VTTTYTVTTHHDKLKEYCGVFEISVHRRPHGSKFASCWRFGCSKDFSGELGDHALIKHWLREHSVQILNFS